MIRRLVRVTGRVQGVFYRDTCRHEAQSYGVAGWVANRDDGSVEAVFEGSRDAVESMISWCRHGPAQASVDRVDVIEQEPTGEVGFRVV
ncbi:MAG TPA: acylphosphatase [Microlunatus sp.]|jgi:acylphosphatase|nr:acylphosphatase [Microlunatus sp.]